MPPALTETKPAPPRPLYRQLQPRWCGLDREGVVGNQRMRLMGAMVEVVAERGYAGASIKQVSALAGVSRQTFYDLYGTREACLLATYDDIVERAAERIGAAYRTECDDWQSRLRAAFDTYVAGFVARPKGARLALVGVFDAGPRAVARTERTRLTFAKMIAASFERAPDNVSPPPIVVKGIVCGIDRVVRRRLADDVEGFPALTEELLAWALCYRSAAVARLPDPARVARASARPRPRAYAGSGDERVRILRATAWIAAGQGYDHLTAGRIVDRAGVSAETFEALYGDVEQCFLATLGLLTVEALRCAERASRSGGDPAANVHSGIVALMGQMASNPVFTRVAFIEILAAGADGVVCREALLHKFGDLLTRSLPRPLRPSGVAIEASVGAIWGIVDHHVTRGAGHLLPALAGHATYLALAPAIGAEAAVRAVLAARGVDGDGEGPRANDSRDGRSPARA
jgi:AcrR family transcriptional regulator